MDYVDKILQLIAECINNNTYREVETERLELKNLAGGWGDDWYKTVCAFLNTNGGIVIIGIQDKNNIKPPHYKFTGYINSSANENHLKQELPKKFVNKEGTILDLSAYLSEIEIRDFLEGRVAIINVNELPADEKFVYYEGVAYQRKLTGDYEISQAEIEEYEELKQELVSAQELSLVKGADLSLLNIDKLNQYIIRFNKGKKSGETLKTSLETAMSFLNRKSFVRDGQPTLLGMLVCGDYVEDYIQGRCEVDGYVKSITKIADDKQVLKDNVINLIEDSIAFIFRNIQIGLSYTKGGEAVPEYPEELIRETINNAIAHRNYQTNRFVIIEIKPNESLLIQNPGMFGRRQRLHIDTTFGKIRRILPIQIARNPKLADLLKSFDRWEGIGKGLTSLIDACLENAIDVPYYVLIDGEIKLFIPKGKVYDETMKVWLNSFGGYIFRQYGRELNEEEKIMLSFFYKSEQLNRLESYTILFTNDNNHRSVIANLEEKGLIFKNPQSPEIYPIYLVDRVLVKMDFTEDLKKSFGNTEIDSLKTEYKEVLNAIYWHNQYAPAQIVSANSIGTFIYLNKNNQNSRNVDLKTFEYFKSRIRGIFNRLEDKKFITRKDGKSKNEGGKPDFQINSNFKYNLFQCGS
jgi:predicted HTH transcriptional regulator